MQERIIYILLNSRDMNIGENIRKKLFRLMKGSICTHVHIVYTQRYMQIYKILQKEKKRIENKISQRKLKFKTKCQRKDMESHREETKSLRLPRLHCS